MAKINIIGLGPGSVDDLTMAAVKKIHDNNQNYLRTEKHPTIEYFLDKNIEFQSYDYLYEEEDDFLSLYENIANDLISRADEYGEINYFVPGNPMIAEKTVEILLEKDIETQLISGLSFIEPMMELIGKDLIDGIKILDGSVFSSLMVDINIDIIITQVYNKRIVSEIKLILSEIYGDEYIISFIHGAGIEGEEKLYHMPIYQLDRFDDIGYLTSIYIPRIKDQDRKIYDFNNLLGIMKVLRGEDGCPWDMKQDHQTLRQTVIEEAYEVVNAIDRGNIEDLVEELGDLLLQIIFHSEIGENEGEFTIIDVTSALANKLIYRHPHIFLEKKVENSKEVVYNWNKLKDSQRGVKNIKDRLANLPALTALMKAYKIQDRAAEIGFDWDDIEGPIEKILEEYEEVLELIRLTKPDKDRIEEEIGDLLMSVVNLSRFLDINPEVALNRSNNKFVYRLGFMEDKAQDMGRTLEDMDLEEMDSLWNLSKEDNTML